MSDDSRTDASTGTRTGPTAGSGRLTGSARAQPATPQPRIAPVEVLAGALSAVWIGVVTLLAVQGPGVDAAGAATSDPLRFVTALVAIVLPVAVAWLALASARSARQLRADARRTQASLDALRKSCLSQAQAAGQAPRPHLERKLDEIVQAQRKTEAALASFTSVRVAPPAPQVRPATMPGPEAGDQQPSLQLGGVVEMAPQPPAVEDFLKALNFPENAEDVEGFRALRRALQDRQTAQLIQASQDVLTLLSQDGIYMDDLHPDRAKPDLWRRFARGERGRTISALGGIRDRSGLALTAGRMRSDTIFRDAVHHFLRRFDHMLIAFEKGASDSELAELAETRTARAFMLLGRVAGMFD